MLTNVWKSAEAQQIHDDLLVITHGERVEILHLGFPSHIITIIMPPAQFPNIPLLFFLPLLSTIWAKQSKGGLGGETRSFPGRIARCSFTEKGKGKFIGVEQRYN